MFTFHQRSIGTSNFHWSLLLLCDKNLSLETETWTFSCKFIIYLKIKIVFTFHHRSILDNNSNCFIFNNHKKSHVSYLYIKCLKIWTFPTNSDFKTWTKFFHEIRNWMSTAKLSNQIYVNIYTAVKSVLVCVYLCVSFYEGGWWVWKTRVWQPDSMNIHQWGTNPTWCLCKNSHLAYLNPGVTKIN